MIARAFPDRVFVTDFRGELSYAEIDRLAERVALHLLNLGLKRRDIVLLQFPNLREFIVVFFALQKIGVIPVMCLPHHRARELSYFAELTGASAYLFPQRFRNFDYLPMARELRAENPALRHLVALGDGSEAGVAYLDSFLVEDAPVRDAARELSAHRPDPFEVAFMLLSGGTTGVPPRSANCSRAAPIPSAALRGGGSLTLAELTSFLQDKQIAKFKLPERLEVVDALPLSGMGKVSKKDLRETISAKLQDERAPPASGVS